MTFKSALHILCTVIYDLGYAPRHLNIPSDAKQTVFYSHILQDLWEFWPTGDSWDNSKTFLKKTKKQK